MAPPWQRPPARCPLSSLTCACSTCTVKSPPSSSTASGVLLVARSRSCTKSCPCRSTDWPPRLGAPRRAVLAMLATRRLLPPAAPEWSAAVCVCVCVSNGRQGVMWCGL